MYSVQDVISLVQSDIGDLSGEKVQRGEYLALLRMTAIPIAQATKIFIGQQTATPMINSSQGNWDASVGTFPGTGTATRGQYWTVTVGGTVGGQTFVVGDRIQAIVDNASTTTFAANWQLLTGIVSNNIVTFGTPNTAQNTTPNIFKFIQVRRVDNGTGTIVGNEYSKQATAKSINERYPFQNLVDPGGGAFSTSFVNPATGLIDGTFTLTFPYAFETAETVTVDYISDMPTNLYSTAIDKWELQGTSPISIPNFLYNTFRYGLLEKVIERLYLSGDERLGAKVGFVSNKYKESLREAVSYALMLKDEGSKLEHQPYRFLSDGDPW